MVKSDSMPTGNTLFDVISNPSEENWLRFVQRYAGRIEEWIRLMGIQDADVKNATQETFLGLHKELPNFKYDKNRSFRGWLRTVACNKAKDVVRKSSISRRQVDLESWIGEKWDESRIDELDDAELLEIAMQKVKSTVNAKYFEAFELLLNGASASEVAKKLNVSLSVVYKAKWQVTRMIRTEIQRLVGAQEETSNEEPQA